jgi:hypothetical protein
MRAKISVANAGKFLAIDNAGQWIHIGGAVWGGKVGQPVRAAPVMSLGSVAGHNRDSRRLASRAAAVRDFL